MRVSILYSILFFNSLIISSQNLVPNPGFEDNVSGMVTTWQQPLGGYYHYTIGNNVQGYACKGEFYNGLCLLNKNGSEYLQVRLIEPLVKGAAYKLVFFAKTGGEKVPEVKKVGTLDWHFNNLPYDVRGRARIKLKPEVRFPIDTGMKYGVWTKFEQIYIARGNEKWLIIGKFFEQEDSITKLVSEMNKEIYALRAEHKKSVKQGVDSITNFYKSLPEYNSKKRTQKQQAEFRKLMSKQIRETNAYRKLRNAELAEKEKALGKEYGVPDYYYDVRFYFDEVSIVPVDEKHSRISRIIPSGIPDKLISGQKFTLENILFETGKANLLPASFVSLNKLLESLKKNPNLQLKISGHTDNVGSDAANKKLSEDRAVAVMNYLISKGISKARFSSAGYGPKFPIADNSTASGRKQNRRVEFEIK